MINFSRMIKKIVANDKLMIKKNILNYMPFNYFNFFNYFPKLFV